MVVTCSDPSHLAALKEALAKLQGQQQLAVADLIAKLDPAGPLAQEVSAAQAAAGGADVSRWVLQLHKYDCMLISTRSCAKQTWKATRRWDGATCGSSTDPERAADIVTPIHHQLLTLSAAI